MAERGGARPGAGRPKGAKDRLTREAGATISEMARAYTDVAIAALARIAEHGESESAQVAAANALLDRGYGKASQPVEHNGEMPVVLNVGHLTAEQLSALASIKIGDE